MPQAFGVIKLTVCRNAGIPARGKNVPEIADPTSVTAVPIVPACPGVFDQAEIKAPTPEAHSTRARMLMRAVNVGPH